MDKFFIDVRRTEAATGPDDAHAIALRYRDQVFTRLIRPGEEQLDDYLRAPPSQLAFWLVDNWWRVRHECVPPGHLPSAEWRLAHDLASIGAGYVWPRLTIWGEGERMGLACRSDPPGVVGPVRYITDSFLFMLGTEFEDGADAFLNHVADETNGFGSDRPALRAQLKALRAERDDPELAAWRRLEAQLGLDPDEAPESLMDALGRLSLRYGQQSIEEAVQAHPGIEAVDVLNREIEIANRSGWDCDFTTAVEATASITRSVGEPPWSVAEEAGRRVRESLSVGRGPIDNNTLANIASINPLSLQDETAASAPYGLRVKRPKGSRNRLVFRTRWIASRRFELSRAIGDAIWSKSDTLGPLARSKTARQKFQRAFAQNLLCPFDDLIAYIDTSLPTDDDIAAAARHFDVSERVVQTTLVNKNILERDRFEDLVEAA